MPHGGRNRESLAAEVGLHPRSSADFLDALVSLDVLDRDEDGTYRNTAAADLFLDRNKPSYVGGILEMADARLFGFWNNLTDALKTGAPQNEVAHSGAPFFATLSQDPIAWRNFLNGMNGVSTPLMRRPGRRLRLDRTPPRRRPRRGPWRRARRRPAGQPGHHRSRLRTAPVRPVFEEFVAAHGLADRLAFHGGDFFSDPLPEADVYVMGQILHDWNLEQRRFLLDKAYAALPEGGTLIVYDAMIDDERRRNTYGLMLSLNMLIDTEGGSEYTVTDVTRWLRGSRLPQGGGPPPDRRLHRRLRHQVTPAPTGTL